jgi:hypothetical protein
MLAAAVLVLAVGWFTNLRELAHGAMLSVAVFALLPFAIIAAALLLALVLVSLSVLAALAGGDPVGGEDAVQPIVELGVRMIPGYYRWLAARRHPLFWGIPLGVLLGGLALWAMLAVFVLPGEAATVQTLADVRAEIDRLYADTSRYPRPTPAGHLTWAALGRPERGDVVLDGFGRPFEYHVAGAWKFASYRLRSHGYDARPGGRDDFCLSGATKLGRLAAFVESSTLTGRKWSARLQTRFAAVQDLRCPEE